MQGIWLPLYVWIASTVSRVIMTVALHGGSTTWANQTDDCHCDGGMCHDASSALIWFIPGVHLHMLNCWDWAWRDVRIPTTAGVSAPVL